MTLCVEITPKGHIHYNMPEWIADAMKNAFNRRVVRSISSFMDMMPEDIRSQIEITRHPNLPQEKRFEPNWVFFDELASPEAIKAAIEYMERKRATHPSSRLPPDAAADPSVSGDR